ncbi:hypothetical protein [Nocardioides ochotonae]|uniref:hypothetical protein n=1 Tax=Nocardioides ochotonae TaxID=2685869 RepID=UPI00140AFABC|nr:hypothetical protein [Nocardioides ochotonae]
MIARNRRVVVTGVPGSTTSIARRGADAIEADRCTAIVPPQAALVVRSSPSAVLGWLIARTGWRR